MSQVVYRGVSYDTEIRHQQQLQQEPQQYNEVYRGVKFTKKVGSGLNELQLIKNRTLKENRLHDASITQLIHSR